jgi:glycine hydroxymethyltransferase
MMDEFRDLLRSTDPEIHAAILGEEDRQRKGIELIPSENYTYPEVLVALGSVLTNKYSEGYPGRRYYGGQEFTDQIENLTRDRATRLFRAEHANVQPLSGSPMNQAAYLAFMKPGDTILGMDLSHGGHLTHGAPVSHMGKIFNFVRYKTQPDQAGAIDFDEVRRWRSRPDRRSSWPATRPTRAISTTRSSRRSPTRWARSPWRMSRTWAD